MRIPAELVSHVFRHPDAIQRFSMGDWDRLVRQARQSDLLARLHALFIQHGLDMTIPAVARWHFEAASGLVARQHSDMRRELSQLRTLLAKLDFPLVIIKGAAYVAADLPAAKGRSLDAIDLLVPSEHLGEVESALALSDWHTMDLPEYDRRYFRRWRHDVPQLQHLRRPMVINLHHAILPESARFRPDTLKLRRRATELQGFPGMAVLAIEDLVLHAATLLFHDDRLSHGLRDLSDLDLLLRQAASDVDFWPTLLARAEDMALSRPLFYALRYTRLFFGTPIPDALRELLANAAPNGATLKLMDGIYRRVLAADHHSCRPALIPLARHATYLRTHWLRRPPSQLVPHLLHKAFFSPYHRDPKPA
ncbi:MAG: nucleotidyltransferase family protein [Thiobacillus sp.]